MAVLQSRQCNLNDALFFSPSLKRVSCKGVNVASGNQVDRHSPAAESKKNKKTYKILFFTVLSLSKLIMWINCSKDERK